ncbi:TPA: hypothetical protein ACH3X2_005196 [Trebouxia sp. C0005]
MLSPIRPPRSIHRSMLHTTGIRINAGLSLPSPTARVATHPWGWQGPPATERGELSTLRQMMEVPNEPGLSPNNGLENALLSDQSMASNPRKGQAKRFGAKTTSHDGKAGHVMTHVCHCVRQED